MHCGEGLLKLMQLVTPGSCGLPQTLPVLGANAKQHKVASVFEAEGPDTFAPRNKDPAGVIWSSQC